MSEAIQRPLQPLARTGLIFAWAISVLLTWLIPVLWTGTKHGYIQVFPERWKFQHAVAGLFTEREGSWNQPIFLVRASAAGAEWKEVPRGWLSQSMLAGYRNRMDRLLPMIRRSGDAGRLMGRLGEFVAQQVALSEPGWGAVSEVRIMNTNWPSKLPEMMQPAGRWQLLAFDQMDPARVSEMALVKLKDKQAVAVLLGTSGKSGLSRQKPGSPRPAAQTVSGSSPLSRKGSPRSLAPPLPSPRLPGNGTSPLLRRSPSPIRVAPSPPAPNTPRLAPPP